MVSGVVFVACDGEPLIVGHATPNQSALVDGGVTRAFPTSMGDPFEVDAPVILPDTGVSDLSQAFDGAMHLVAWTSPRGVMAVRYDLEGLRLDAAPILLAPPGLAAGDTLVTPRQGGGFEVFSQGLLFAVERDGSTSPGERGAGGDFLFDVGLSSGASPLRLVRSCLVEDDSIALRTIAVAPVTLSSNSRFTSPGRYVQLPLASVLAVALTRLGDHDYLATISGDSTARLLELRVLASGDEYGPPVGAVDLGTVVFSTPVMARDLSIQTVGDRVMLVWRDETSVYSPDDGGAVFTARLSALSVRPGTAGTFDLTGPSVLMGGQWLRDGSLVTQTTGTSVLVGSGGVLTSAHLPVSPPIFEVDPVTLVPGLSISADQLTGNVAFRGCSWDGEACLVLSSAGGQENGIVVGQRVPLGGAMIAATPEQALPGQRVEQGRPGVVCASTTCLVTWRAVDPHEPWDTRTGQQPPDFDDVFRAVRVSKASGLPIDLQSLDLFPPGPSDTRATDAKAASTGNGFVAAEARCAAGALQITVRVVPETGAPASPQVINFTDLGCPGGGRQPLMIVADGTRSLIVEKGSLRMVLVGADGVAHARPSTLYVDWPGSLMDGVMVGDKAVVAFSNGPRWTTVVFELTTGVDAVGLRDACPDLDCEFGAGRLVMRPGHPLPGWIHLAGSVNSAERRLTWTELDAAARPVGPPATLASGWAYGLVDVVADERGLAVLTTEARYPFLPFLRDPDLNLVFRRFDSSQVPQPGLPARVIATGLATFDHALASCGDGQWLTAYQIGGSFRPLPAGASPSRVIGRFVYEAP